MTVLNRSAFCRRAARLAGAAGSLFQRLHGLEVVLRGSVAQSFQHAARELEGRGGGKHHHRHAVPLLLGGDMESHRRMGVAEVAVLLVAGADLPCHLFLTAPAAVEALLNGLQRLADCRMVGCTGGAGGHADAPGGQLQQHAFALDELEGEVHVARQTVVAVAVQMTAVNL